MIYLFYTVHIIVCLFLILVVLLQQGKGADLSVFGGGATQAAFGARGAATMLHKLTVGAFVAFIVTTMSIGFLTGREGGRSVMAGVEAAAEEPAPATGEAAQPAAESAPPDAGTTDSGGQEATDEAGTATPTSPDPGGAASGPAGLE